MTPDEQHQKYYKENPSGNHDTYASIETKKMFSDLKLEMLGLINEHAKEDEGKFDVINAKLENKVSNEKFYWVIGILLSFVCGMFYLIWDEIKATNVEVNVIKDNSSQTKSDVSFIKGILEHPDTKIEN